MTHTTAPALTAARAAELAVGTIAEHLSFSEAIRFRSSVLISLTLLEDLGRPIGDDDLRAAHRRAVRSLWSSMTGYRSRPSAADWDRLVEVDRLLGTDTLPAPTQAEALAAARLRVAVAEQAADASTGRNRELADARSALALLSR